MKRLAISSLCVIALLGVSACGHGRVKTTTNVETTTTGQQLIDLKTALDDGAITEKEYEKKRKEILKKG